MGGLLDLDEAGVRGAEVERHAGPAPERVAVPVGLPGGPSSPGPVDEHDNWTSAYGVGVGVGAMSGPGTIARW